MQFGFFHPVVPRFGDVTLAVLAGGRSERFGSDKALAHLGGVTLLVRLTGGLGEAFGETIVVADSVERYRDLCGVRVVADRLQRRGPLGGIHAALEEASLERVLVTAVDVPLLDHGFLGPLVEQTADAAAFVRDGFIHPLPSIYRRRAVLPILRRLFTEAPTERGNHLASGWAAVPRGPSPLDFFRRLGSAFVSVDLPAVADRSKIDPLTDVDTPSDLATLACALNKERCG